MSKKTIKIFFIYLPRFILFLFDSSTTLIIIENIKKINRWLLFYECKFSKWREIATRKYFFGCPDLIMPLE
ncbi:TPA: hypothetical protein DD799_00115 [Candidatus Dependentiae bacterium]|nr:hypothetical protein [Candidatus Dependentiae bacterium]